MNIAFDPSEMVYPFPPKPAVLSDNEKQVYIKKIKQLLQDNNAVLIAHYYTDPEIQALAEITRWFCW